MSRCCWFKTWLLWFMFGVIVVGRGCVIYQRHLSLSAEFCTAGAGKRLYPKRSTFDDKKNLKEKKYEVPLYDMFKFHFGLALSMTMTMASGFY